MAAGALDGNPVALERPRCVAADGLQFAGEIAAGQRDVRLHDLLRGSRGDHMAAKLAGAGAQVDHIVGMADGVFIVLHHQHGITEVTQRFERLDQPLVVALVQPDRRFIEHIEHSTQARADLRGQADALPLAARERGGIAVQRQIAQPDRVEKLKPFHHFPAQTLGDQPLARRKLDRAGRLQGLAQGQRREVGNGQATHLDRQRFRPQALALAGRADGGRHVVQQPIAIAFRLRLIQRVAQVGQDAVETGARRLLTARAMEQQLLMALTELFERLAQVDLVALRGQLQQPVKILRSSAWAEGAIGQRL